MKMTRELRPARFCFREAVPAWLIPRDGDATVRGSAGQALLDALLRGETVDEARYLSCLGQPGGVDRLERGVLGLVLPGLDPGIVDFPRHFDELEPWSLADGSPVDGDDQAHRRRARLALWSLLLSDEHQISLSEGWRRQVSAAAHYLLCRFSGHRRRLGVEWELWASMVHYLGSLLLDSLPVAVEETSTSWRGYRRFKQGQSNPKRWRAVAFREAGLCVLCGAGVFVVGAQWGCELSDGTEALAWVHRDGGPLAWRLESARSAPDRAGFRLVRGEDERLIVTGRHGRVLLISEGMDLLHKLDIEVSSVLSDLGPRRLGANGVSLELDRTAAWTSTAQLWAGRKGGKATPIRLRLAFSRTE